METTFLYLAIVLASLAIPLLRSFEPRIAFYKSYNALFAAIVLVAIPFLIWDAVFTHYQIWGFNARYILGLKFAGLPLEEILFFIVIPYCGVFVYRVLNYFWPQSWFHRNEHHFSNFLIGFSMALAIVFYNRWYPLITFLLLALLVFLQSKIWQKPWLGSFYRMYLFLLVPFLIVNGLLTGTGIAQEIVWYNNQEITGTRILSIPLEDMFYGLLMMLGVISLYEYFGARWQMGFAYETSTE